MQSSRIGYPTFLCRCFNRKPGAAAAFNSRALDEGRDILQAIQREEQVELNRRVPEQEWAAQSTQILNFIPTMERAASDMQKEVRGFLLTGDPAFVDS